MTPHRLGKPVVPVRRRAALDKMGMANLLLSGVAVKLDAGINRVIPIDSSRVRTSCRFKSTTGMKKSSFVLLSAIGVVSLLPQDWVAVGDELVRDVPAVSLFGPAAPLFACWLPFTEAFSHSRKKNKY